MGKIQNFDSAEHARRLAEEVRRRAAQVAENQARDARRVRDAERVR